MDKQRAAALFEKFRNETLTDGERAELESWYLQQTASSEPLLDEMIFRKRLAEMDEAFPFSEQTRTVRLWPRIAAAASILLILSIGGYFLFKPVQPPNQLVKNDIPPGHNQATLTLSDGKKIVLAKGLAGKLAQQGYTDINATNSNVVYSVSQPESSVSYNTLSTARGEQSPYPLVLADGTKVWLNAESSITFPTAFPGKERIVNVTGEAYFEVRHNAAQPFKVETRDQVIEDIGTSFDVSAYSDEPVLKTTLVEGSIEVNHHHLKPGDQAHNSDNQITITQVDTRVYTAWKSGYFRYDQATLPVIMREFARWYKVNVVFTKPPTEQVFNMKISRKVTLNRVLQTLANGGVSYKLEGDKLIINP